MQLYKIQQLVSEKCVFMQIHGQGQIQLLELISNCLIIRALLIITPMKRRKLRAHALQLHTGVRRDGLYPLAPTQMSSSTCQTHLRYQGEGAFLLVSHGPLNTEYLIKPTLFKKQENTYDYIKAVYTINRHSISYVYNCLIRLHQRLWTYSL